MTTRSMTFLSSRTLPGQRYVFSRAMAAGVTVLARFPYSTRKIGDEVLNEQRDVFSTLAQRRNENWNDVQPEVQIFAKATGADFCQQVLVGGGEHPNIDLNARGAARPAR